MTSFLYARDVTAFEWVFECTGSWGHIIFDGATIVHHEADHIGYLREYRCAEPLYDWRPQ